MTRPICAATIAALFLWGCGGGGGDGSNTDAAALVDAPTVGAAQGLYTGSDANGNSWNGFVLASGDYDFVFLGADGATLGLIRGTAATTGDSFISNDTKKYDVGNGLVLSNMISAKYAAKSNIVGSIAARGSAGLDVNFSLSYNAAYEQPANIAAIAGTYSGLSGSTAVGDTVTITIAADGTISGQQGVRACSFSGSVSPSATSNTFDISMTFNDAGCPFLRTTLPGVMAVNGGVLIAAVPNSDQSDAFVVRAQK